MDEYVERSELRNVWQRKLKPRRHIFKATQSNLMRALLLHRHGGSYLDTDTISVKAFPPDLPNFVAQGKLLPLLFHQWPPCLANLLRHQSRMGEARRSRTFLFTCIKLQKMAFMNAGVSQFLQRDHPFWRLYLKNYVRRHIGFALNSVLL